MQINEFLLDPLGATKVKNVQADIQKILQGHFDKVAAAANATAPRPNPPHTVKVQWSETKPSPSDTDLLIYFLTDEISVVSVFAGKPFDPIGTSHWGLTRIKTKTNLSTGAIIEAEAASEVHTKNLDPGTLSAIAFHEAMHHKMLIGGDEQKDPQKNLHTHGGLAAATVDSNTQLSNRNITEMAGSLTRKIKQFPEGFDKLAGAKKRRDQGDDFWYQIS